MSDTSQNGDGSPLIACTYRPETCREPLSCYEVRDATSGNVSYSFCGCLASYGFGGPNCDEPSSATYGFLAVNIIVFVSLLVLYIAPAKRICEVVTAAFRKKTKLTEITRISLVCLLALFFMMVLLAINFRGLTSPNLLSIYSWARVSYLWNARLYLLLVVVYLTIFTTILMTGTWYATAMSSRKLRRNFNQLKVRRVSFALAISVVIVLLSLLFTFHVQIMMLFLAGVAFGVLSFLAYAYILISKELMHFTNSSQESDNAFKQVLKSTRKAALFTGSGIAIWMVAAILNSINVGVPAHDDPMIIQPYAPPQYQYRTPFWAISQILFYVGLVWTQLSMLKYGMRALHSKSVTDPNTISSERMVSKLTNPATSKDLGQHLIMVHHSTTTTAEEAKAEVQ